jgi:hypothetical protein
MALGGAPTLIKPGGLCGGLGGIGVTPHLATALSFIAAVLQPGMLSRTIWANMETVRKRSQQHFF